MVSAVESRTFTDERTFSEIKRLATAGLEGPELLRRVAERLSRSVSYESYCFATLDPASSLMTHVVEGGALAEWEHGEEDRAVVERIYFEEDLKRIASLLRERRKVALLSEYPEGLDRSMRYDEFLKPLGYEYELGSLFVDGSLWGGGSLTREAGDADFSGREVALMERVAPYVGAGLKSAALRVQATAEPVTDEAPGVLTLDRTGHVVSSTPSAERWLRDLEDLHPAWREGALPVPVRMIREVLRQALNPRSDRDLALVPRVRVRGRSGQWLALYGSLTEPFAGRPSETVVVVEPAKPAEVAWLTVVAYGLSPREEEVVKLVVRGLSNREISRTLYISENTVQRHLSNVFEKVGVRSRNSLLQRLFFDNLLPGM
jgi:DNA-binding CsgD family transcriptional regulator